MCPTFENFELFYFDPDKQPGRCEFFEYHPPALPKEKQMELSPEERIHFLKFYAKTLAEYAGNSAPDCYAAEVVSENDVQTALKNLKPAPVPSVRREIPLSYLSWRLAPDADDMDWTAADYDFSDWHESTVPLIRRMNRPLQVIATWTMGDLPEQVLLDIGAVIDSYTLFVNGAKVTEHDGYEPHRVDITPYVMPHGENRLAFLIPPNGHSPIGIGDKLTVLEVPRKHIEHVFVSTKAIQEKEATISVKTTLSDGAWGKIIYEIFPWFPTEGEVVAQGELDAEESTVRIEDPVFWEVGKPHLYQIKLRLWDEGACTDEVVETFGVRTVCEKDGKLWLNGKPFFMKSFGNSLATDCDNESYGNLFPPDFYILRDMLLILKCGGNFMRIHHWGSEGIPGAYYDCGWPEYGRCLNGTNYERFADIADQLGLCLVWITRHWCNWPSGFAHHFKPDKMEERLTASIKRVQNHPSIAMYEGLNEVGFMLGNNYLFPTNPTGDGLEASEKERQIKRYQQFLNRFTDLLNEVDGTRLILPDSPWGPFYTPDQKVEAVVNTRDLVLSDDRTLYDRPNTVWDVHTYSGWYSGLQSAFYYRDMSWGNPHEKPILLTELGAEAMPRWELYQGCPWYGVWVNHHHYTADFERNIYGRPLRIIRDSEMDISQAYQGLCILYNAEVARMTGCDGMNINLIGDGPGEGAYHKGVTDLYRKAKLGYFAARMAYQKMLVSGTEQSFCLAKEEPLALRLAKEADAEPGKYQLTITVTNEMGEVQMQMARSVSVTEDAVQNLGVFPMNVTKKGLYRVTYRMEKESGGEHTERLE